MEERLILAQNFIGLLPEEVIAEKTGLSLEEVKALVLKQHSKMS